LRVQEAAFPSSSTKDRTLVVIASGKHPFPLRTRKLSPIRRWY
jgi:hypothetical protein